MRWLIDEAGVVYSAESEQLRTRLGFARRPLEEREAFLISNLGFVAVRQLRSGLVVRWRPTYVNRETLAGCLFLIRDQADQRVVISSLAKAWRETMYPAVDAAADAMVAEFGTARATSNGYFISRPSSANKLPPDGPLSRALAAATTNQLRYDPPELWQMLQRTVKNRFLLLDPNVEARRFRVMSVGSGYTKFSHKWTAQAQGMDFEDQPDDHYARAVVRGFWAVLERGTPAVEDVEATLWVPSRGRMAARYTRLLLPLQVGGRRCILSTSELDRMTPASVDFVQK